MNPIKNVLVWAPFFYMDGMWQMLSAFYLGATTYVARRMSIAQFFEWLGLPHPLLHVPRAGPQSLSCLARGREAGAHYIIPSAGGQPQNGRPSRALAASRVTLRHDGAGHGDCDAGRSWRENFERTCGSPAPQRRLKIVREDGIEVARGEIGELWVSGPGIMWGYYKRPAANAEVFRGEWFRTGDYFRQDEAGYYYIVGRLKDTVRRSGENIAAREVEAVLVAIEGIEDAAAVAGARC